MPVTRSSARQGSHMPPAEPYSPRHTGPFGTTKPSEPPSNEIIVLSSDDDEPPHKGTLFKTRGTTSGRIGRKKPATRATPLALAGEVLELSSDDESQTKKRAPRNRTQTLEKTNKELERTVKKLQEEVEELKLRTDKDALSGLEDLTSCEVCTVTMWCPYILPECGHSFCTACLIDWFSTIQAHHLSTNPQLDNSRAALSGQLHGLVQMVPNLHAYGTHGQNHMRAVLAELRRHRPEYTCPSCRKVVLTKPVENFKLKSLVGEIASMMGETHQDASSLRNCGPFDHFFAAPILAR